MVPDKFNMIDMEGIDIITSQGEEIPGLYQKLVESIAQCRYQCIYNWKFDGILIPPTYVEMTIVDDVVWINEGVSVDEEDVIRIYSLEPPVPEPVIESLSVTENGTYLVQEGVDGFNPVLVQVPESVFETINITENGTYQPSQGVDGFSRVTVNVSAPGALLYTNYEYSPRSAYSVYNANTTLAILNGRAFGKVNDGLAYGAVMRAGGYAAPYLCSTEDPNYVRYQPPSSYTPKTLIKDGVTWYWMGGEWGMAVTPSTQTGALINYNINNNYSTAEAAMSDFIDFILSIPDTPIPVYKISSGDSGIIMPPNGYDGFGPLLIQ